MMREKLDLLCTNLVCKPYLTLVGTNIVW